MKARASSAVSIDASSASPQYETSKRVGLPVQQRLETDIHAELDYVRMVDLMTRDNFLLARENEAARRRTLRVR